MAIQPSCKCPACGKKGVRFYPRPNRMDGYWCRYCDWECFTLSGSLTDKTRLLALEKCNPNNPDVKESADHARTWTWTD